MPTPPVRPIDFTPIHYSIPLAQRKALMEQVKAHGVRFDSSNDGSQNRAVGFVGKASELFVKTFDMMDSSHRVSGDPLNAKIMNLVYNATLEPNVEPASVLTLIQAPNIKNLNMLLEKQAYYDEHADTIKPERRTQLEKQIQHVLALRKALAVGTGRGIDSDEDVSVRAFVMPNVFSNLIEGFSEKRINTKAAKAAERSMERFKSKFRDRFNIVPLNWYFDSVRNDEHPDLSGFVSDGVTLQQQPGTHIPLVRTFDPDFDLGEKFTSRLKGFIKRASVLHNPGAVNASMATGRYILTKEQQREKRSNFRLCALKKRGQRSAWHGDSPRRAAYLLAATNHPRAYETRRQLMPTPPVRPIDFTPIHYSIPLAERKALMEQVKAHGVRFDSSNGGTHSHAIGTLNSDVGVFVKTVWVGTKMHSTSTDPLSSNVANFIHHVKPIKNHCVSPVYTTLQAPTLEHVNRLESRLAHYKAHPYVFRTERREQLEAQIKHAHELRKALGASPETE